MSTYDFLTNPTNAAPAAPQQSFIPPPAPTVGPLVSNAPPPVAATPQQFQQPFIAPAVSQPFFLRSQPVLPAQFFLRMPVSSYATLPQMGTDISGEAPQAPAEQAPAPTIAETASFVPSAEIMAPEAPITERFVAPGLPTAGKLVSPPPSFDGGTANVFKRVEANAYAPPPGWPEGAVVRRDPLAPGGFSVTVPGPKSASMKVYPEDSPALTDVRISPPTEPEPALPPPADALAATVGTVSADDAMRAVPSTPGGLSAAPKDDSAVRRVEELYSAEVEAVGTPLSDEAKLKLYTRTVDRVRVDEVYKPRLAVVEARLGKLAKDSPSYDVLAKEKERLEARIGAIEEKYKTTVAPVDKEAEREEEFLSPGDKYLRARTGALSGDEATVYKHHERNLRSLETYSQAEKWYETAESGAEPPKHLSEHFDRFNELKPPPTISSYGDGSIVQRLEHERRIFDSLEPTTQLDILKDPARLNMDSLVVAHRDQALSGLETAFEGATDPLMAGGYLDALDGPAQTSLMAAEELARKGEVKQAEEGYAKASREIVKSQFERAASARGISVERDGSLLVDPASVGEAMKLKTTLEEMARAAPTGSGAQVAIASQISRLERGIDEANEKTKYITGLSLNGYRDELQKHIDLTTPKGATSKYRAHLLEYGEGINEAAQRKIKTAVEDYERSQGLPRDEQRLKEEIADAISSGKRDFRNYVMTTQDGVEFGTEGPFGGQKNNGKKFYNTANILAVGNLALLALAPLERAYWQKRQEKREDERYDEDWERLKEQMALQNDYRLQQISAAGEASRGGGGSVAGFRPARV